MQQEGDDDDYWEYDWLMDTWQMLKTENLERLKPTELEDLCYDIVRLEAWDRFEEPNVEGSFPGPDGGRDVTLKISRAPSVSTDDYGKRIMAESLVPGHDAPFEIVYSYKAGQHPVDDQLKEIYGSWAKRPCEVLMTGGFFALVTNREIPRDERGANRQSPKERLVEAFGKRLGEATPPDLESRVYVYTANELSTWLRGRKAAMLYLRWRDKLGLPRLDHFASIGEWRARHGHERAFPEFQWDSQRERLRGELVAALGAELPTT